MKIQTHSGLRAGFFVTLLVLCAGVLGVVGCSSDAGSSAAGAAGSSAGSAEAGAADAGAPGASADATLSDLVPSLGALVPVFVATKMTYTLRVPNGATSVALTPTATNAAASILVAGAAVPSGDASAAQALPTDGTPADVTVVVTAEDTSKTATYTIHIVAQALAKGLTIHSVGDSTMASYDATAYPNQRGWMQMFPELITPDVTVDNAAINGTSSKSFYLSGTWDMLKMKLCAGDYVFIQFAHNDEKDAGIEGKTGIGTAAWGAYHDYLTKYVNEARALGAIPVLVTPVVRLGWDGATLTPVACHDLTGNGTAVGNADYPAAMRDVATTANVPLLDLTVSSKALVEQYGPTDAKSILYISTDDTHLQVMGATVYAQLAATGLSALGVLKEQMRPDLGLLANRASLGFGTRYLGTSLDTAFSVLGLSLQPDAGNVTVTAPLGFLVGTSADHLAATVDLPYTRGALPPTTVYVRFQPLSAVAYADPLTLSTGSANTASVALGATGLDVPTGGTEATALYALDSATAGTSCVATGAVTCADESFSNLYVKDYQPLTTLLPAPAPLPTQRLSIVSTPAADTWPLETDVSTDRWVEFAVNVGAGKNLSIDTVSFYAGGAGGPTMGLRARSSTAEDFSAPTELLDAPDNATNTLTFYSVSPLSSVAPGGTFRLRIYPYSKALATKKYLSLQAVSVHGVTW